MLNQKTISVGNAAASIVQTAPNGVTTAFIPRTNNQTIPYLRIATQDPHNFFVGSLVTVTGLKNTWFYTGVGTSTLTPIIAQPILRIDDPYSFCIDIPLAETVGYKAYTAYAAFNGANESAAGYIYPWATAQLTNGQLASIDIKYGQHLY